MEKTKQTFQEMSDEDLSEQILRFAQDYQEKAFPNLKREQCPSESDLLEIAKSGSLPDPEFRHHLLYCSPCFQEFRDLRRDFSPNETSVSKTPVPPNKNQFIWKNSFLRLIPIAVLFLIIFGLGLIVIYIQSNKIEKDLVEKGSSKKDESLPGKGESQDLSEEFTIKKKSIGKDKNLTNKNAGNKKILPIKKDLSRNGKKTRKVNKPKVNRPVESNRSNNEIARNFIKLNLSDTTVLRGESNKQKSFNLPSQQVNVTVNLLKNSPKGTYEISLLDEFGKSLIKTKVKESNGKNLNFDLDLRNKKGNARLCIAPKSEIPDCFLINMH
jgi:hypothetical protein